MFSAKQGHYWYHFGIVFGMTRSLIGDWTRDLPHSKPALYHLAIEEAVTPYKYVDNTGRPMTHYGLPRVFLWWWHCNSDCRKFSDWFYRWKLLFLKRNVSTEQNNAFRTACSICILGSVLLVNKNPLPNKTSLQILCFQSAVNRVFAKTVLYV